MIQKPRINFGMKNGNPKKKQKKEAAKQPPLLTN